MNQSTELPEILRLERVDEHSYRAPFEPRDDVARGAVFGGQILAQMIIASALEHASTKTIKSLHAVFARAGGFAEPLMYEVDSVSDGRTFGTDTITCRQGSKIIARALLLLTADEPDFIRHTTVEMPTVVPPVDADAQPDGRVFPGAMASVCGRDGSSDAVQCVWTRYAEGTDSAAVGQAVLAWATDGYLIGTALLPHPDYDEAMAHHTIDTAVVSHTINFHEPLDASDWVLLVNESVWAGRGRSYGRCNVFTRDGRLVANCTQDSMVRAFRAAAVDTNRTATAG